MNALWTSHDAAAATGGACAATWEASGVSIDTRIMAKHDLFIALRGANHDGHQFIAHAFEKGAAAVVSEEEPLAPQTLQVADAYEALVDLARHARRRSEAYVVAVTGSVGKTGTVAALAHALGGSETRTHAPRGSYNNRYGVPLTLARMPQETRRAILEIGMNHAGEIRPLSRLARPDLAIITAIAPVHMEFFDGLEGVAAAKSEIFEGLKEGGAVILNRDTPFHDFLHARAHEKNASRILSFGEDASAHARLLQTSMMDDGQWVQASILGREISYRLRARAPAHALNSLAILLAVALAGEDPAAAAERLSDISPMAGRGAKHRLTLEGGSLTLIDETYSANPASMAAALEALALENAEGKISRRVAILGDMAELGDESPAFHEAILPHLKKAKADRLFCCGELMRHLHKVAPASLHSVWQESAEALAPHILKNIRAGDIIMVKGSRKMTMEHIVQNITDALSDRRDRA